MPGFRSCFACSGQSIQSARGKRSLKGDQLSGRSSQKRQSNSAGGLS